MPRAVGAGSCAARAWIRAAAPQSKEPRRLGREAAPPVSLHAGGAPYPVGTTPVGAVPVRGRAPAFSLTPDSTEVV
jgi:hypothetical protein